MSNEIQRKSDRQIDKWMDGSIDGQMINRQMIDDRDRQMDIDDRKIERQIDRQTDRQMDDIEHLQYKQWGTNKAEKTMWPLSQGTYSLAGEKKN